ncbi:MAG: hypothetical protein A2137_08085 [Chloroflexi bacterium RBG_16_58_8]|nr:MAG: hypothetical protein A2137_08085 [Chloroflexi bacterium RBG_16_58_8]
MDDLGLDTLGRAETGMSIGGWASSEAEVIDYTRKLQATGRFAEVTISNISREVLGENETVQMSFTLALKLLKGTK